MKRSLTPAALALALLTLTSLTGCGEQAATTGTSGTSTSTTSDNAAEDAAADPAADATADTDEPLAALTAADRAAVVAQKICPVSDEDLGSMGTPIKVTVDGKDLYVCCDACVEEAKSNFAKYLAKIEPATADADASTTQ